jgi:hypothetical protein
MTQFKEWIAERFFEKQLDESYALGVREGMECAAKTISFRVGLQDKDLTKTQRVGLVRAMYVIDDFKAERR